MAAVSGDQRVRGHPAVRTLLLTRGELSAWLLDERTGTSQKLNTAAAAVWALMEEPLTVDELVADLAETFGLDGATASETVAKAIETFQEADLVVDDGDEATAAEVGDAAAPDEAADSGAVDASDDGGLPPALTRAPDP